MMKETYGVLQLKPSAFKHINALIKTKIYFCHKSYIQIDFL